MLLMAGMPGGTGTSDGIGVSARFNSPRGIVAYGDTLYVADQDNQAIRKIDISTGLVTTIAGYPGRPGVDDGIGMNARFRSPEGITTDGIYLYVADTENHAIRKIDIGTGNVATLAGRRGQNGEVDGAGKNAMFRGPAALALLGNFLYVADTDNHTIRRVDKTSGDTVTIAGSPGSFGSVDGIGPSARFYSPLGLTTDGRYLYIADTFNSTIRRLDPEVGEVITLAGKPGEARYKDGLLTEALFYYPYGITIKGSELFVTEPVYDTVRVINLSSVTVYTLAGVFTISGSADGPAGKGQFNSPIDITAVGDYLYVADLNNHSIRRIDISTGELLTIAGYPPHPGDTDTDETGEGDRFSVPGGVTIYGDNLFVTDTYNHTIRKIDIATGAVTTLVGSPGIPGITDSTESPALFSSPTDVIADGSGEYLFIVDTDNHVIRWMSISTGEIRTLAGYPEEPGSQDGIGWDARFISPRRGVRIGDKLYIADTGNHVIRKIDLSTREVSTLAGEKGIAGSTDTAESISGVARFNTPSDITTDGTVLYITDTGNHVIRRVDVSTGTVETIVGARGSSGLTDSVDGVPLFNLPEGIAWYNAVLYVSDTGNHIIRKIDIATKEVSRLAGDVSCIEESEVVSGVTTIREICAGQPAGTSAYGDSTDGTGKTTSFNSPTDINTDGTYLYVMDTGSNRIRRVDMNTGETKTFSYSKNKGISVISPAGGDLVGNLLYLADRGDHLIRKLDITALSGAPLITIAGNIGVSGYLYSAGYSARFNGPVGITADGMGNLYVADTSNHTLRKVVISTGEVTTIAGIPGRGGFMNSDFGFPMFNYPRGICVVGGHLYVADPGNHLIRRVNLSTGYVGLVAGLSDYVTNEGSPGTSDSTGAAAGFNDPRGIASDGTYLYVTDSGNHTIRKILRATGQVKTIAGMPEESGYKDGIAFEARFSYPRGIALDGDYLYVADTGNNVIRRINKYTGEVLTFSGKMGESSIISGAREDARYNNVVSVTTAPYTPYLYFTDSVENVVGRIEKE